MISVLPHLLSFFLQVQKLRVELLKALREPVEELATRLSSFEGTAS